MWRSTMLLLCLIAVLSGTPLRQAEAASDFARSRAELGQDHVETIDGGVGDDAEVAVLKDGGDTSVVSGEHTAGDGRGPADAAPASHVLAGIRAAMPVRAGGDAFARLRPTPCLAAMLPVLIEPERRLAVLRPWLEPSRQEHFHAWHSHASFSPCVHADRAAGRDRHHRRADRPAAARRPGGEGSGEAIPMPEQPEADRAGDAQLSRHA